MINVKFSSSFNFNQDYEYKNNKYEDIRKLNQTGYKLIVNKEKHSKDL